jgi:hypothetical protein
LKVSGGRPPVGRVAAAGGAASRPLRLVEPAKQVRKLQWQGRVNDVGRRDTEHMADGGEKHLADRRAVKIHIVGESERARVAGPQHGCISHPRT